MEAKQLRLGNLMNLYDDYNSEVTGFTNTGKVWFVNKPKHEESAFDINDIKPIPLTEDWLIELGFENDIIKLKHGEFIQHEGCTFYLGGDSNVVNCQCFTVNVKYVHELQNLYFALTGEELKTNS